MASLRLSLLLSLLPATAAATRGEPGFVGGHASGSDVAKLAATGLSGSVVGGGGSGGNQASAAALSTTVL